MFTKVSVLIPTRHRLARLRTLIDSFESTNDGRSELVFRADDDDLETVDFLWTYRTIVGPRLEGYRSLPDFFNQLAFAAHGDVLMLGNDDMVFRTPRWDTRILAAANKYPDGIFNFGVTTHNHLNFPFSTVSKSVVETLGFLYDPRIFWGDIFLLGVMSAFRRAIALPDIVIDHDWMGTHPDVTFAQGDEVRRSNWMEYHQQAIDEAVEKLSENPEVRKLREGSSNVDQRNGWSIIRTGTEA